jgi:hypothetical protein
MVAAANEKAENQQTVAWMQRSEIRGLPLAAALTSHPMLPAAPKATTGDPPAVPFLSPTPPDYANASSGLRWLDAFE